MQKLNSGIDGVESYVCVWGLMGLPVITNWASCSGELFAITSWWAISGVQFPLTDIFNLD
jgi:hypothetical protein